VSGDVRSAETQVRADRVSRHRSSEHRRGRVRPRAGVRQYSGVQSHDRAVRSGAAGTSTVPTEDRTGVGLTVTLALMASALLQVALADGALVLSTTLLSLTVLAVPTMAATVFLQRLRKQQPVPPIWLVPAILGVAGLPVMINAAAPFWSGQTDPLEVTWLLCLRHFVLGLAAASVWPQYRRPAAGLSVFLTIFSLSMSSDHRVLFGLALYSLAGIWWLMTGYWNSLSGRIRASHSRGLPGQWLLVIPVIVLGVVLLLGVNHGDATTALRGFMPTSGGPQW